MIMSGFAVKISNTESTAQTVTMFDIGTTSKSTPSTPTTPFTVQQTVNTGSYFNAVSLGQAWLQPYTGKISSITVIFDNNEAGNDGTNFILTIKNKDTGATIATYTGLTGIKNQSCTYTVDVNVTAGVNYTYELQRADSGQIGLRLTLNSTSDYDDGNMMVEGSESPNYVSVFTITGTYGSGSGTPEPTPENTGPSYTALVQSLRQDPQYYNVIRIDSTNAVQRQKMMKVITRDILNLVTEESTINAFDFITTKDFNNQTIIYFKQPVLIGVDSFEYEIEPNTEVTMLFSYQKPEERQTMGKQITNMYENVKQKIVKGEYIAEFKRKDILKQIKIITTTIGTISLLVYLIRRIK